VVRGPGQTASLSAVEAELSDGTPFGSYGYLSTELAAVHSGLLTLLAEPYPAARELLDALARGGDSAIVVQDPLVRRTVEDGVCTVASGMDAIDGATLDAVLTAAAAAADARAPSLLGASARCVPLGADPGRAYVWADDRPASAPGRRFVAEVQARLPGFRIEVPTADQVQVLVDGQRLACRLAPRLAGSALAHLRVVIVGDFGGGQAPINALTVPGLPGVVVISPTAVATGAAAVAETLVHESVHLKFLDIEYVRPLFPVGFRPYSSPRITPIWHADDPRYGGWPLDRLLTSMHVYVSLIVFFRLAADRGRGEFYPREECAARVDRYRTRATWLHTTAQEYLPQLSAAGREFVAWLGTLLGELEP
jgi:hypothetical protein